MHKTMLIFKGFKTEIFKRFSLDLDSAGKTIPYRPLVTSVQMWVAR